MISRTSFRWNFSFSGGTDYVAVSESITFNASSLSQTLRVTFIDDGVLEPDERLELRLSSTDSVVILNPRTADVIIQDDDGQCWLQSKQ